MRAQCAGNEPAFEDELCVTAMLLLLGDCGGVTDFCACVLQRFAVLKHSGDVTRNTHHILQAVYARTAACLNLFSTQSSVMIRRRRSRRRRKRRARRHSQRRVARARCLSRAARWRSAAAARAPAATRWPRPSTSPISATSASRSAPRSRRSLRVRRRCSAKATSASGQCECGGTIVTKHACAELASNRQCASKLRLLHG